MGKAKFYKGFLSWNFMGNEPVGNSREGKHNPSACSPRNYDPEEIYMRRITSEHSLDCSGFATCIEMGNNGPKEYREFVAKTLN